MLPHSMATHWTQNDIAVQGARMHYYRTGSGAAPGKPALVRGQKAVGSRLPVHGE